MLAELEGIFCQPASSTVLAGLLKLSENVKFEVNDQIVLVATGGGLKTIKSLESFKIDIHQTSLSKLENTISSLVYGT